MASGAYSFSKFIKAQAVRRLDFLLETRGLISELVPLEMFPCTFQGVLVFRNPP